MKDTGGKPRNWELGKNIEPYPVLSHPLASALFISPSSDSDNHKKTTFIDQEVTMLRLLGQIQPSNCLCKYRFTGAQPCPFIRILTMAAFLMQKEN